MSVIARLMDKLRCGTATPTEIESLDRRLFCLGAAASAGSLIARPAIVDFGTQQMVAVIPGWSSDVDRWMNIAAWVAGPLSTTWRLGTSTAPDSEQREGPLR